MNGATPCGGSISMLINQPDSPPLPSLPLVNPPAIVPAPNLGPHPYIPRPIYAR